MMFRLLILFLSVGMLMLPGCPPPSDEASGFGNMVDKTNGGAALLGTAACMACHTDLAQGAASHRHFSGETRALTTSLCPSMVPSAGNECESCHGPGGDHIGLDEAGRTAIDRSAIFVDPDGTQTCRVCHGCGESETIPAANGFIAGLVSDNELRASGGHAAFDCTFCHDPHVGLAEGVPAIRNDCTVCHTDRNMALHDGKVFAGPDGETETLTCQSCHMPLASVLAASTERGDGRVGDRRTHIFRLSTEADGLAGFFTGDGDRVQLDAEGRAAVPVEFSCLRCHNTTVDGLFSLTAERAAEIAGQVHADLTPR